MKEYDYILIGAEEQAALSFAEAYPELIFLLVTNEKIIDGWDLPNVKIEQFKKEYLYETNTIVIDSKYFGTNHLYSYRDLVNKFTDSTLFLDAVASFEPYKSYVVKGNRCHKMDALQIIEGQELLSSSSLFEDQDVVLQNWFDHDECFKVFGFIKDPDNYFISCWKIDQESVARKQYILSAESVDLILSESFTNELILNMEGFFNLTVLVSNKEMKISSIRKEPLPFIKTIRKEGIDLLNISGKVILKPGCKMMGEITYNEYEEL